MVHTNQNFGNNKWQKEELNKDLPLGAIPYTEDISGLKLNILEGRFLTRKDVYDAEADNID